MIRIHRTWWGAQREFAARTWIVCDICGAEGPPQFGDTDFDIGLARARAQSIGFVDYTEGHLNRMACAPCASARATRGAA